MILLLQSLAFGLAVAFIIAGIIGVVVPILPGMLLVWLTVLVYAWVGNFQVITLPLMAFLTLIALVTGTSGLWLPLLGAQKTGASKRAMFLGFVGGIVGTFITPIIGTIVGYALGIMVGEYLKVRDLNLAFKASIGGVAGWGVGTAVEIGGAIFILIIFVIRVLTA